MAEKKYTIFQSLDKALTGNWNPEDGRTHINSYDMSNASNVIYKTKNKEDYEKTKLELQQNAYLKERWLKANVDLSVSAFSGLNNLKLMYRDADLMDSFPEIGAALDIISEESVLSGPNGMVVNVSSDSDRIKSILEDLFVNRLNLQIMAQLVIRAMCKYGNQFMLLDIDNKLGVKGWRQLPVFNVERLENGITNPYGAGLSLSVNNVDDNDLSTKFVWFDDNNSQIPFRDWQIAHFRLLSNSMYLPYGVSFLNSARRHWRMLSLMEDLMLIYRLERSIERRVYKIYVGAIDDADVQAYVENIANNFKRTPIIDPMTGQVDLRKNILPVHKDTPIPLLDGRTITIKELAEEFDNGKENFVYSIQDDTHIIVPGKVVWCGKNYTADNLYKITLDDDTYCIMAGEHELIMRDGSKKRADALLAGESIMPFYRSVDKHSKKLFDRYEKVYNPNNGKYEFTHRLIGGEVVKENSNYNTIHHKDFNKYNNNPTNLLWMDYNEHHKMHGELARNNWKDPEKRKKHIENLSKACIGRVVSEDTKTKISKTLKEKYANGELDYVKNVYKENIIKYNKSEKHRIKAKEQGLKCGYRKEFKEYNESDLHKQHNEIRRIKNIDKWKDKEKRDKTISNMTVKFDDYVWNEIRKNILIGNINTQNQMIDYVNNNLIEYLISTNSSKKIQHYRKVTKSLVRSRIKDNGFANFAEYYEYIKKNHKVKSIEIIGGDDVYCMTVVGLNGEEDRHNFAINTWNADKSVCQNGIFVSNCVDNDIFIPVRDQNAPTPIDTLSAGQNLTAMDDIKYVFNKVCTALRIPKPFLNFEESAGEGKNLSLLDIRFTRTVNRIQQAFLMELTKIATIHLYILGFTDDLTNFTLTMNNPSTLAEQIEIENIQKKVSTARDAVSDPGNGIPIMSQTRALKEIMKWSEKEIKDNLEEIRLEKALAAELEKTTQIINRTGIFDTVDRIYGEPGAEYQDGQGGSGEEGGSGGGGPMGGGGDFGGGLDSLGAPGMEDMGDMSGEEGTEPTSEMGGPGGGPGGPEPGGGPEGGPGAPPMESYRDEKPLITEGDINKLLDNYLKKVSKNNKVVNERVDIIDKAFIINEEINEMIKNLDEIKL